MSRRTGLLGVLLVLPLAGIGRAADIGVAGSGLTIVDPAGAPARRKAVFKASDPGVQTGTADPRTSGATLELVNPTTGLEQSDVFPMPAIGWKAIGSPPVGFKYHDAKLLLGPVKTALVKNGKLVKLVAKGAGVSFALGGVPQTQVGVVTTIGSTRFCALFGGTVKKDDGFKFQASGATAPASCPALPTTSTTTSTTSTTSTNSTTTSTTTTIPTTSTTTTTTATSGTSTSITTTTTTLASTTTATAASTTTTTGATTTTSTSTTTTTPATTTTATTVSTTTTTTTSSTTTTTLLSRLCTFRSGSKVRIQGKSLDAEVALTGFQRWDFGVADGGGVRNILVPASGTHFDAATLPLGAGTLCVRAVVDGSGVMDCDGGLANYNVTAEIDHNTGSAPGAGGGFAADPECDDTFMLPTGQITSASLEDGSTSHPHTGTCNSPLHVTESSTFAAGGMKLTENLVARIISSGSCPADDAPLDTAAGDIELTGSAATGVASARIYQVNNTTGNLQQSSSGCGLFGISQCVGTVTGTAFGCGNVDSGNLTIGKLGVALPALDISTINDALATLTLLCQ